MSDYPSVHYSVLCQRCKVSLNECTVFRYYTMSIKKNITVDDVVGVAKAITNDSCVRVLDYSINDCSDNKSGFTASHYILRMTVQKSNESNRQAISAFVKSVSLSVVDDFDKSIDVNSMITDKETCLLKTLASQFKDSYKGDRCLPVHHYTTKNVIVMEDLKSHGYQLKKEFYDNYTVLKSVLTSLARFYSCSILAKARMNEDSKHSATLNEQYEGRFTEMMFTRDGEMASWYASVTELTCVLAEHFGYDPTKVRKLFDRACDMVKPSKIHRNNVCHGDVHSKNFMFADDSPPPHCIPVDFQTYRYAPMVTDILQFLHINATRKFREEHEAELMEFYHSVLKESIESNDTTGKTIVPTMEEISKGMEDFRVFGLVIACIYYPFLFLDPELMKKHARDSEFNTNFVTGDRIDFTFAHMKDNELFRNKIEEAIRELIEKTT